MNVNGQSDGRVVPAKPPNKAVRGRTAPTHTAAEVVEGRRPAKGNTTSPTCSGLRADRSTSSGAGSCGLNRARDGVVTDTHEGDISLDQGRMLPSPEETLDPR